MERGRDDVTAFNTEQVKKKVTTEGPLEGSKGFYNTCVLTLSFQKVDLICCLDFEYHT